MYIYITTGYGSATQHHQTYLYFVTNKLIKCHPLHSSPTLGATQQFLQQCLNIVMISFLLESVTAICKLHMKNQIANTTFQTHVANYHQVRLRYPIIQELMLIMDVRLQTNIIKKFLNKNKGQGTRRQIHISMYYNYQREFIYTYIEQCTSFFYFQAPRGQCFS